MDTTNNQTDNIRAPELGNTYCANKGFNILQLSNAADNTNNVFLLQPISFGKIPDKVFIYAVRVEQLQIDPARNHLHFFVNNLIMILNIIFYRIADTNDRIAKGHNPAVGIDAIETMNSRNKWNS